jgi:hypothetical protein
VLAGEHQDACSKPVQAVEKPEIHPFALEERQLEERHLMSGELALGPFPRRLGRHTGRLVHGEQPAILVEDG